MKKLLDLIHSFAQMGIIRLYCPFKIIQYFKNVNSKSFNCKRDKKLPIACRAFFEIFKIRCKTQELVIQFSICGLLSFLLGCTRWTFRQAIFSSLIRCSLLSCTDFCVVHSTSRLMFHYLLYCGSI